MGLAVRCGALPATLNCAREAQECERWNRLHPGEKPKVSYLEKTLKKEEGPFISSSDYVRALGEQLAPWIQVITMSLEQMEWGVVKREKHYEITSKWMASILL